MKQCGVWRQQVSHFHFLCDLWEMFSANFSGYGSNNLEYADAVVGVVTEQWFLMMFPSLSFPSSYPSLLTYDIATAFLRFPSGPDFPLIPHASWWWWKHYPATVGQPMWHLIELFPISGLRGDQSIGQIIASTSRIFQPTCPFCILIDSINIQDK